jgi:hypothetical protein
MMTVSTTIRSYIAPIGALFVASVVFAQPAPVQKTNPMRVYMHYMPWFETPATMGPNNWGYHWDFNRPQTNPNIMDAAGKRQIASHYYPMIGPYDSSDPHVIEYHPLLMKYAGIDGVMIDWYGIHGTNGDINSLRNNAERVIRNVDDFGLKFSVVIEDRFWANMTNAQNNIAYLRQNPNPAQYPNYPGYFQNPDYIRLGAGQDPLLNVFGPITFQTPSQWDTILNQAGEDVTFQTLWYESAEAGADADGEYAWIWEEESADNHLLHQRSFLNSRALSLGTAGGVAYPGFEDYYEEGGVGDIIPFDIPHNGGQTLDAVLDQFEQYTTLDPTRIDYLQLATFNDFGEGTMFEPTVETGFSYLERIQEYTGVPYSGAELQLVYRLYLARKEYAGNASITASLNQVSGLLASLDVTAATSLLNAVAPLGDFDSDGDVDSSDFTGLRATFGTSTILHGGSADMNFDGKVDASDYVMWRKFYAAGEGGGSLAAPVVPEPSSCVLVVVAILVSGCSATRPARV